MINSVVLVGRLTKEVILRKTGSGTSVASYTLAVNRRYTKDGEQGADFINCVSWKQQADFLGQYGKKGMLLGVEGRIQTRSYDNSDGRKIFITEVVADNVTILESKKADSSESRVPEVSPEPESDYEFKEFGSALDISSDDLPF